MNQGIPTYIPVILQHLSLCKIEKKTFLTVKSLLLKFTRPVSKKYYAKIIVRLDHNHITLRDSQISKWAAPRLQSKRLKSA